MLKARFYKSLPGVMTEFPKSRWLFMVLTVKNCPVVELRQTLKDMGEAWARLRKRPEFEPIQGWVRTTEVTIGNMGTGYAHPHFNVLMMVPSSWFGRNYVKHERWVELWKECARLDYDPQVHISVVKGEKEMSSMVMEVLKYSVKESDLTHDADWLLEFTRQRKGLRFVAAGGALKAALKKVEESTDDELVYVGEGEESN